MICMSHGMGQPVKAIEPGVAVDTYYGRRTAMALSLTACGIKVIIQDPGCTAKIFPAYFIELARPSP